MSSFDKKYSLTTDPYKSTSNNQKEVKNIYWGEVISIEDTSEGGRIKVRLPDLDNRILNENLPWAYPMLPKFFHLYPKVGEVVRVFIEDTKYPQRSRFWMGSVISQLQKVEFDSFFTSLSTTNIQFTAPEKAISTFPEAKGVFPEREDVAIIGRVNTDVILRDSDVEIRAGKHEQGNVFKLNKTNPASHRLTFETTGETTISTSLLIADRIALISHDGIPKFQAAEFDADDRNNVFDTAHPLGRGDVIVEALELLRKAIIQHVHAYDKLPADKSGIIIDLEKVDFTQILQKNIVIN